MLQPVSQEPSKIFGCELSHSCSIAVQLLKHWIFISELLLKEHLGAGAA